MDPEISSQMDRQTVTQTHTQTRHTYHNTSAPLPQNDNNSYHSFANQTHIIFDTHTHTHTGHFPEELWLVTPALNSEGRHGTEFLAKSASNANNGNRSLDLISSSLHPPTDSRRNACYLSLKTKKTAIKRVQALADISRSILYAFAVYKAISLQTCMLSQQRNPCTDCKSTQ